MKRNAGLLAGLVLAVAVTGRAETEDHLQKTFIVTPGGELIVDVSVGSIEVIASDRKDVAIEVFRKADARGTGGADREKAELQKHEVTFTQEGNNVTVRAQRLKETESVRNMSLNFRYVIQVPAKFDADVKTSGGSIKVADLNGDLKARTSGGSLQFAHISGPIDGQTSGGSINLANSEGKAAIQTSGGPITINRHKGDIVAKTSGGDVSVEDVEGQVQASTSGGSVDVSLAKITDECRLEASGGGTPLFLRTSGGSIHLRKL